MYSIDITSFISCTPFQAEVHCKCSCPADCKLPRHDLVWLKAQREKTSSKSPLAMRGLDRKQLKVLRAKEARKLKTLQYCASNSQESNVENHQLSADEEDEDHEMDEKDHEMDYVSGLKSNWHIKFKDTGSQTSNSMFFEPTQTENSETKRGYLNITPAVEVALRFGATSTVTAAIINGTIAALIDDHHLHPDLKSLCVDAAKVTRFKAKVLAAADSERPAPIKCVFIDGRRDDTLITKRNMVTGRHHRVIKKENHITVTAEPDGDYVTHFTPPPKTRQAKPAKQAAISLHTWMVSQGVDQHRLRYHQ